LDSFAAPVVYWKDCNQFYLMGKAITHGVDPYTSLATLAGWWLPAWHPYPYPAPYPPFVGLMCVPLAGVNFVLMAWVWLVAELVCLFALLAIVWRWVGGRIFSLLFWLVFLLLVVCPPINGELRGGQVMTFFALLLVCTWKELRADKNMTGGLLLGFILACKIIVWPVALLLIFYRRWVALVTCCSVFVLTNAISVLWLGLPTVVRYYTHVGAVNAELWRGYQDNMSTWGWGARLCSGIGWGYHLLPAIPWPAAVPFVSYLAPLALLVYFGLLIRKTKNFDTFFGLMLFASVLLSPILWNFYVLLLLLPLVMLGQRYFLAGVSLEYWLGPVMLLVVLVLPFSLWVSFAQSFGFGPGQTISFFAGLFTIAPALAMLLLSWLFWRSERLIMGPSELPLRLT